MTPAKQPAAPRRTRDPEGVCAACLRPHLADYLARWDHEHPDDPRFRLPSRRNGNGTRQRYRASVVTLAERANVNPRRLDAILTGEQHVLGLDTADRLLCAIDREYLLARGELDVIVRRDYARNPTAATRDHACGREDDPTP